MAAQLDGAGRPARARGARPAHASSPAVARRGAVPVVVVPAVVVRVARGPG